MATSQPTESSVARKKPILQVILVLAAAALAVLVGTRLRYPTSPSAPPGLYLLLDAPLVRDGWVVVCLPVHLAELGKDRGYLHSGRCPARTSPVLKRIAALPGDLVEVTEQVLRVNGEPLPNTGRRRHDRHGRAIPTLPAGTYQVAPGHLWLYSDYSTASWDSRYFGAVPLAGVRSSACRLWPSPDCAF